ncbi:MAG: insulinase family protein [Planctomycetes bacterium]|nr:insulinase family protein [Planctomycetota bacterium]
MSWQHFEYPDCGLYIHLYPTDAFKTTTVKAVIRLPLDEQATANSLLLRVLSRGCRKFPTMRKISVFLEALYGADFGIDVAKIGENYIMEFDMSFVSERFIPGRSDGLLPKAFDFIRHIIGIKPSTLLMAGGNFRPDYLEQEQMNLKNLIESLFDNKIAYAEERCTAAMCADEPYGIYEYGKADEVDRLTGKALINRHKDIIASASLHIFGVGVVEPDRITRKICDIFGRRAVDTRYEIRDTGDTHLASHISPAQERLVRETVPEIDQGKLVMGYRTNTTWANENDVFALMMANGVLGGFPHSKIFQNVREKAGLAYYASSKLEKTKGLLLINAGINHDKFDQAVKVIKEQIDAIKAGDISRKEMDATKGSIVTRLKSVEDSASSLIDYQTELIINNRNLTINEITERIQGVTKDRIASVAGRIKLDTVYFLTTG